MSGLTEQEIRRQKARDLRYKKPMLLNLNIDTIKEWLWDAQEACSEWSWMDEEHHDEMLDAFDGNDEEYSSYQNAFAALDADLSRFCDDFGNEWIPECFDDLMCGIGGDGGEILRYDAEESDYYGLAEKWEERYAIEEAKKRLTRMTKAELLEATGQCFRIALSYMALKSRVSDLTAAIEIVRGINRDILQTVKDISTLYDEMQSDQWNHQKESTFDLALERLPDEAWLR